MIPEVRPTTSLPTRHEIRPALTDNAAAVNRILKANATELACPCSGKAIGFPNWLPKIKSKNLFYQSGRRDLNPRPLDPSHDRPVWPGRTESAGGPLTCDNALKASRAVWTSRPALAPVPGSPGSLGRERGYPMSTKINDDSMSLEIDGRVIATAEFRER